MNKKEALQAMLDGKKVHNTAHVDEYYYKIDESGSICTSGAGLSTGFNHDPVNGWEIYKEPIKIERNKYVGKQVVPKNNINECALIYKVEAGWYGVSNACDRYSEDSLRAEYYIEGEDF